jgi:hypothetical protein
MANSMISRRQLLQAAAGLGLAACAGITAGWGAQIVAFNLVRSRYQLYA